MKRTMITTMLAFGLALTAIANPVERAELLKAQLVRVLVRDGWHVVQESPSNITFQRQANAAQAILMNLGFSGASGTWATERLDINIVPENDHLTACHPFWSVNSQNAFGQMSSVPITGNKPKAYVNDVVATASAGLPAKYACQTTGTSQSVVAQKEALLAQSGFKVITVTTPQQQQAVSGLAEGRCSLVKYNGKQFYVFPTAKKDKIYVGKQAQFNRYEHALEVAYASHPGGG